jgi:hypothetical protein
MSEPIVVNQSTSVVQVYTSTVVYPNSAVVLLSSITAPGTIITIRDITGYASTNRGIAVSTTTGVHYLDGPGCNVYNINQPYGFLTVTPRTSNVWAVINTFAFPDQAAHPSVEGIDARQGNFSNLSGNTGAFNDLTVYSSTFLNVVRVSSILAQSISTQTLAVTSTLNVFNLSTTRAQFSSVTINNPLSPSTLLEVNGSMRASTIFLTNSAYVRGSLVYNTNNIVSTVQGLGTATYVSTTSLVSTVQGLGTGSYVSSLSLVSTVQGLGTASYMSSASLVSTVQGLGSSSYISSPSLVSTVQGLGTATYVSTTGLVSTVQGLGTAGYLSSPVLGLISTVIGLGSSGYVSSASLVSTVQGLGSSTYVSTASLVSTVQGLGTASYMSTASLVSTVQGLGSSSYISSPSLVSTVQGLGTAAYLSTASLVSTVQGLGTASYVSSLSLVSTVQGLGSSGYISSPNVLISSLSTHSLTVYGPSTFINSSNMFIGNSISTNTLRFIGTFKDGFGEATQYTNTVIAERIYDEGTLSEESSELLLFKGNDGTLPVTYAPGPDRVRVLAVGGFRVDIACNGGIWPVGGQPPPTAIKAFTISCNGYVGIGCNTPSFTLDVAGTINASNIGINGSVLVTTSNLVSTVQGAGTAGYVSSASLVSTVQGLGTSSYISSSSLASTVQGLGTAGYLSSIGTALASTVEGLGSSSYVSSTSLASTVQGLGSSSYVSSTSLASTVQGLGSSSYVSSPSLASTVQGLGTSSYISSPSLVSTVQGLGLSGYISSPDVRISSLSTHALTVYGPSTFINTSNMFIGDNISTNTLRFIGTYEDGFEGPTKYTTTVIGERIYDDGVLGEQSSELLLFKGNDTEGRFGPDRVRVLSPGGFQVDVSPAGYWPIGSQPPPTAIQAFYIGCNGRVGIGCNSPSYTLDVNGSINASGTINARGFVNSDNLVSTVKGLGTSSYISSTGLASTVQGLGTSSYISSSSLASTVEGLGTAGYLSSIGNSLASTVQGLGSSSYVSSTGLVSTVQGLGSSSYISSTGLVSTVQGLGSSGYISSPNVLISSLSTHSLTVYGPSTFVNASNMFIGDSVSTNVLRFIGTAGDSDELYTNTVIGERIYSDSIGGAGQSSELLLFKGNDAAAPFGPDRVRVLSPGGFKVDISLPACNWPIGGEPPLTLTNAFIIDSNGRVGIGCNSPSYTLDVQGSMNVSGIINASGFVNSENLVSTVKGLGTSSYISSTGLASTVQGLGTSSYISSLSMVSTVQGLGTTSYISSSSLVSTVQGLGTVGYVSSFGNELASTVRGLGTAGYMSSFGTAMVSTVQGLGTSGYLSSLGTAIVSTVQGLGTAGYMSSPVVGLVSTVQGLGSSTYISSPIVSLSTLSTQSLIAFGESTFLFSSNVYIGNSLSTNILRFYGTTAYNSFGVNQYARTVIAERSFSNDTSELLLFKANNPQGILGPDNVRVLAAGGFQVDIASNGGVWPINGNPPSTAIRAFTVFSNGYVGIGCNSPRSTLDVNGIVNVSCNIYVNGLPVVTFGNGLSSNYVATSNFLIGASPSTNTLRFLGTNFDAFNEGETRRFTHSVIGERIYAPDELSELLIFKGDNTGCNSWGPDRVRVLSAGGFVVDIAPEGCNWPLNLDPPPAIISNALSIGRDGVIRTASTIVINGNPVITSGGSGGSIVLSCNVGINCNTPAYTLDVNGSLNVSGCNVVENKWVAVGSGVEKILTSSDGYVWSPTVGATFSTQGNRVAWNGSNQWIAVGVGTNRILTSTDGNAWTPSVVGATFTLGNDIVWNGSNLWVAVGAGISDNSILRSADGITWTASFSGFSSCWGVATSGSYWVAVGDGGSALTNQKYSGDGISWSNSLSGGFSGSGRGVAYNGSNMWVAVGYGSSAANTIIYSSNGGQVWSNAVTGGFSAYGASVIWNGSIWVATGRDSSSAGNIQISLDGRNWVPSLSGAFSVYGSGVAWSGTKFIATGSGTSPILYSDDGRNWSSCNVSNASFAAGGGIGYGRTRAGPLYAMTVGGIINASSNIIAGGSITANCNIYVNGNPVVTSGGAGGSIVLSSNVGINCNTPVYTLDVGGIIHASSNILAEGNIIANCNIFVNGNPVVTSGGAGGAIVLSCNVGINCNTPAYSLDVNGCLNVSGCNVAAYQWVAVGAGTDKILKSSDGYVWSPASGATFTTEGNRVAWNGSNQWIAVGNGGYTVLRSTDGNSWTPSAGGATFTKGNDVVWNGSNLWVAVGVGNATDSIFRSANGITWTASSTGFSDGGGYGVATSGSYWIAVGVGGIPAANQKFSGDGITWSNTNGGGGFSNLFGGGRGVAYNGSNMWVAVGYGTTAANSILYSTSGGQIWNNAITGGFSVYGASVTWNGSLWVATGSHSSAAGNIQISLDGMNWVPSLSGAFSGFGSGVVWSGTKFIATGTGTSPILYSDDGRNWSSCNVSGATFTAGGGIGYGRTLTGPLYALTVSGDTFINGTLYINGLPAGAAAGGSGGSGGGGGGGGSALPINIELVSSLVGTFGTVGVGCNAPSYTLDVNGTINASSNVFINGSPLLAASSLYSTVRGLGSVGYVSTTQMNALMSNTIVSTVRGLGDSGYVSSISLTSTIEGLGTAGYVSSLGNITNITNVSSLQGVFSSIGVNCNLPAYTLDVNGSIQTSASLWVNSAGEFTVGPRDSSSTRGLLRIVTQDGSSFIQSGSNATGGGVAPLYFTPVNGYTENAVMAINMSNGRVGIGCNTPASALDLVGEMRISRANNYDRMVFGFSPVSSPTSHNWPLISMLVGNANAYLWGDSVYQTPGLLIGYNVHTENGAMVVDSVNNFGGAMIEVGLQRGGATFGGMNFVVSHLGTAAAFSNASRNPAISINSYRGSTPGNYTYINGDLYVGGSNSSNMIRFAGTYGDGFYSTPEYSHTVIAERIYASTESSELLLFKGNGDGVTSGATDLDRVRVLSVGGFKVDIANNAATWAVGGEPPGIKIDALNIDSSGVTSIRSLVAGALTCTGHSAWIWGPGYSPTVSIGYSTVQSSTFPLDVSGNIFIRSCNTDINYRGLRLRDVTSGVARDGSIWTSYSGSGSLSYLNCMMDGTGGVSLQSGVTSWAAYSDERLKENIVNIENALDFLKTVRTVKYSLKETPKDSPNAIGFIAQDFENDYPEVVSKYLHHNGTEVLTLRYTEIIPIAVAAIKEQAVQISTLQSSYNTLVSQMSTVMAKLV